MKEFKEFLIEGVVKKQYPDRQRAKDLIGEANRKFKSLKRTVERASLDDENSNDIVEDCHDIILGIIRAKMLLKGFSASGQGAHESEVSFLNELNFTEQEIEFVNKLRYFRNGILYYGKRFDKQYAQKSMNFLDRFKEKIKPFIIILRGSLGVGKSTVAEVLSKEIGAEYVAIDKILKDNDLEKEWEQGYISQKSFIKANEIAAEKIKKCLDDLMPVIIDGNFYWKSQLEDLIKRFDKTKFYVFTLKASLQTCIKRDKERQNSYGKDPVDAVYKKVNEFDYGIVVDTENKTGKEVLDEIKRSVR